MALPPKRRATAVIAVHGVGDQKPFETARKIGDLLQELATQRRDPSTPQPPCADPGPEKPRYYPFREQKLRINVNPVVMRGNSEDEVRRTTAMADDPKRTGVRKTTRGPFNALVQDCMRIEKKREAQEKEREKAERQRPKDQGRRREMAEKRVSREEPLPQFDVPTEFMKRQLMCYGGDDPEDTYETMRLEGERAPQKADDLQHDIHIYELYWADLSRLKAGIFSIFTELYQLLFHLSSLGTHTVNAAMLQHLESKRWRWFRNLHSWSSVTLTVPIPILNVLMLGIVAAVVALGVLGKAEAKFPDAPAVFIAVVFGAAISIGLGIWRWRSMGKDGEHAKFLVWILPLVLGGVACLIILKFKENICPYATIIEAVVFILLAAIGCGALLWQYDQRRPGLKSWIIGITIAMLGLAGISLYFPGFFQGAAFSTPMAVTPVQILLRLFESAYGLLSLAWGILFALVILTWIAGVLAAGLNIFRATKDRRSRWTGFLLLSLPTLIFSAVTILGWGILAQAIVKFLPAGTYATFLPGISVGLISADKLANAFLEPVKGTLVVTLAAIGAAALPAIWSMLPIVLPEVIPPPASKGLNRESSKRLGDWLSLAYSRGLLISGIFLFAVSTFVLPAIALLEVWCPASIKGHTVLQSLGALSGALFAWVFLARGSLKKLALGFRPSLDIFLDVDNWLREHPLNKNPKARICGRYISLLRYICQWKNDQHPEGYDEIVIVAHSQGTVITADLLRFLHRPSDEGRSYLELDEQIKRLAGERYLPITFFSMGCPLRQLYGRRFPYLYGWASHDFDQDMGWWRKNDLDFSTSLEQVTPGPDPDELGVALWVNAFRSGDYVGRHLWRTDAGEYLWQPDQCGMPINAPRAHVSTDGRIRMEFCIGAGAHTHYWDSSAPMIAEEIDRLIK